MCRKLLFLISLALVPGLVNSAPAALVAHYEFDGDYTDSAGSNHGTKAGDAQIVYDANRGLVLSIDGDGDYVDCGNNAKFNIANAFTVAVWIKVASGSSEPWAIITKDISGWWLAGYGELGIILTIDGTLDNASQAYVTVTDGEWHHVAGVYDGSMSKLYLYVDGTLGDSVDILASPSTNDHSVYIGCVSEGSDVGYCAKGLFDDVRIYDHALTAEEVEALKEKAIKKYYGARSANPANGQPSVAPRSKTLSWVLPEPRKQGETIKCDVLFGTDKTMATATKIVDKKVAMSASASLAAEKTYYWRVDCYDPNGGSEVKTKGLAWRFDTINRPPVVDAGSNQWWVPLEEGTATVTLNGTVTDDGLPAEPGAYTTKWSVQSSPDGATVKFIDKNSEDTTATFTKIGTYELLLTANDGKLDANDVVTITVVQ